MNIKEFFKRDNLDEMQKQTLLKIESRGFWVLWAAGGADHRKSAGLCPAGDGGRMVYLYAGVRLFGPE